MPDAATNRAIKSAHTIARRSFLIGGALVPLAPALVSAQSSSASTWPTRPVALIIPFPAGGAMDVLGRGVAQDLADKLGQPFVADNRVGAAGKGEEQVNRPGGIVLRERG